jgi:hypothetical protein
MTTVCRAVAALTRRLGGAGRLAVQVIAALTGGRLLPAAQRLSVCVKPEGRRSS